MEYMRIKAIHGCYSRRPCDEYLQEWDNQHIKSTPFYVAEQDQLQVDELLFPDPNLIFELVQRRFLLSNVLAQQLFLAVSLQMLLQRVLRVCLFRACATSRPTKHFSHAWMVAIAVLVHQPLSQNNLCLAIAVCMPKAGVNCLLEAEHSSRLAILNESSPLDQRGQ
jgi:hypothetical protein